MPSANISGTLFEITGLAPGGTYEVTVTARNASGPGPTGAAVQWTQNLTAETFYLLTSDGDILTTEAGERLTVSDDVSPPPVGVFGTSTFDSAVYG